MSMMRPCALISGLPESPGQPYMVVSFIRIPRRPQSSMVVLKVRFSLLFCVQPAPVRPYPTMVTVSPMLLGTTSSTGIGGTSRTRSLAGVSSLMIAMS